MFLKILKCLKSAQRNIILDGDYIIINSETLLFAALDKASNVNIKIKQAISINFTSLTL